MRLPNLPNKMTNSPNLINWKIKLQNKWRILVGLVQDQIRNIQMETRWLNRQIILQWQKLKTSNWESCGWKVVKFAKFDSYWLKYYKIGAQMRQKSAQGNLWYDNIQLYLRRHIYSELMNQIYLSMCEWLWIARWMTLNRKVNYFEMQGELLWIASWLIIILNL